MADWGTYDPMAFDVLRETQARLRGVYLERWHIARDAGDASNGEAWLEQVRALDREVASVDVADETAVVAKREDLAGRLAALVAAEPALGAVHPGS